MALLFRQSPKLFGKQERLKRKKPNAYEFLVRIFVPALKSYPRGFEPSIGNWVDMRVSRPLKLLHRE